MIGPPESVMKIYDAIVKEGLVPPTLMDERLSRAITRLPENLAIEAMNELHSSLTNGMQRIPNPAGYLFGIVRRMLDEGLPPESDIPMGELTNRVLQKLQFFGPEEIDFRCLEMFKQFPEHEVCVALDELQSLDRSKIMSVSSYIMGILRRYQNKREKRQQNAGSRSNVGPTAEYQHGSSHTQEVVDLRSRTMGPPPVIPLELTYGYGDDEYVPEMPRALDGFGLGPRLQEQLEMLLAKNLVALSDLDSRVLQELQALPEHSALAVIHEFLKCDISSVRNIPAYMLGIVKRVLARQEAMPDSMIHPGSGYYGYDDMQPSARVSLRDSRLSGTVTSPTAKRARMGGMEYGGEYPEERGLIPPAGTYDYTVGRGHGMYPMDLEHIPLEELSPRDLIEVEVMRHVRAGVIHESVRHSLFSLGLIICIVCLYICSPCHLKYFSLSLKSVCRCNKHLLISD